MPSKIATPIKGYPKLDKVPAKITNATLGTPAIPLLVSIKVPITKINCIGEISIPTICRENNIAKAKYNVEPSKLKV